MSDAPIAPSSVGLDREELPLVTHDSEERVGTLDASTSGASVQDGSSSEHKRGEEQPPTARRWTSFMWLPLAFVAIAAGLLYLAKPGGVAESAVILTTLNALFVVATSFAVAYLAAHTYLNTAQRAMLALGCAALSLGVIYLLAGPLVATSLDVALVLHNGGLLGTAALFLVSAVWFVTDRASQGREPVRPLWILLPYAGTITALGLLTWAALAGVTPAFFLPGHGVTAVREAVLASATAGFVTAALLLRQSYRKTASRFLDWYSIGLGMFAVGLATVWLGEPGSAISWLGRAAQYAAGAYMLVAILAAVEESGSWNITLRRALRESESRFHSLFESMTEGVALHELIYEGARAVDYRLLDVNPSFERHTGMPVELARGRLATDLYETAEAPYLREYANVAESGEPYTFETYFEPLRRHFRITAVALDGARFATVFDDVTARKRADEALSESEERYRLLHDTMLQGVVYQDADGTIISMNPAAERILGKGPADFLGSSSVDVEHDTLREDGTPFPGLEHPAMVALRTGKQVPGVLMQVYNPREAQYRLIGIQAVPLFRPGEERPYRVYTVFDDVTERRRAEEAIRRQAEMLDQSFDAIIVWRLEGAIEHWNRGAQELYGFSEAEAVGKESHELLSTVHPQPWSQIEAQLREHGRWEGEVRHRGKDGGEVIVSTRNQVIRGRDGVERILETNRDVTESVHAEQRIQDELATTRALLEAATTAASLDLDTVLQRLVGIVAGRLGRSRVVIHLFEDDREMRTVAASTLRLLSVGQIQRLGDYSPELQHAATGRKPIIVDFAQAGLSDLAIRERERLQVETVLYVPILLRDRLIGVMTIDEPLTHLPFSPRDVELASAIAAQAAVAIENARLFEAERSAQRLSARRLETSQLLLEAARTLNSWTDLDGLLKRLADLVLRSTGHARVYVALLAEDRSYATFVTTVGKVPLPARTILTWDQLSPVLQDVLTDGHSQIVDFGELPPERHGIADSLDSRLALHVPIVFADRVLGHIAIDDPGERREFTEREVSFVEGIASQAAVAIENARLHEAENAAQVERAAREERNRLARDLHDSVTQALFAATLKTEALMLAEESLPDGVSRLAEEVGRLSRGALAQMRTLLLELRGEPLEGVPIAQLLRHLVEASEGRSSVNVELTVPRDVQPPSALHVPIYRITQEALTNVTRHAGASKAWVDLDVGPGRVRLVVGDDGRGFEPGVSDPTHMGLRSMRERAVEAGAQFDIVTELGGGTLITVDWRVE